MISYGKIPEEKIYVMDDDLTEFLAEIHYLAEYRLLKGKISGFYVGTVSR